MDRPVSAGSEAVRPTSARPTGEPWLSALWAAVAGRPFRLPPGLTAAHPELADVRWRVGGLPPRLGGWGLLQSTAAAITLWRTVWLAPGTRLHPRLLLHELRHVQQFDATPLFPILYLWNAIVRGYAHNPYELDAEAYAVARLAATAAGSPAAPSPDA